MSMDDQKYISEVESLLKYFYKTKHPNNNNMLVSTIFSNFGFDIVFYYYQEYLFDVSINLRHKYESEDKVTTRKEELTNLETPFNSSILSKTLEEGSQIRKLIFWNTDYAIIVISSVILPLCHSPL